MKKYKDLMEKYNLILFKKNIFMDCINLNEAVLDPIYYENIETYISQIEKKIRKQKYDNLEKFCRYLTLLFYKYSIRFVSEKDSSINQKDIEFYAGITRSGCKANSKGSIIIYCNKNILKIQHSDGFYNYFSINVIRIIGHELIHRNQIFHLANQKLRDKIFNTSELEFKKYLTNKQELMARAWQIIEEFRYKGLNDTQILSIMRKNKDVRLVAKSQTLATYFDYFEPKDKVFKELYKYIYLYLTNQSVE